MDIFNTRPIETDTVILDTVTADYDDIPVFIEKWFWDGICGSSCIVPMCKLEEANQDPDSFIEILKDKLSIEGDSNSKVSDGFLFLNFNFSADVCDDSLHLPTDAWVIEPSSVCPVRRQGHYLAFINLRALWIKKTIM